MVILCFSVVCLFFENLTETPFGDMFLSLF